MASIGKLNIIIGATSVGLASGLGKAQGMLGNFGGSIASGLAIGGAGFASIAATAGVAGLAIAGAGAVAGTAWGVKLAADLETATVSFKVMLGSAEKAKQLIGDLQEMAAVTPFETEQLTAASRQLLAFGISNAKLLPTLKALGDVSAGTGKDIGELSTIYGQVRTAGRLMGQDLLQLTSAGIPMIDELAKHFGVVPSEVRKMVEDSKVSFNDVASVFQNLTSAGGKFANMMAEQSQTVWGKWSTLSDNFKLALTRLGEAFIEGVDLKPLLDEFSKLANWFRENAGAAKLFYKPLGEAIWVVVDIVNELAISGQQMLKDMGISTALFTLETGKMREMILWVLKTLVTNVATAVDALQRLGGHLIQHIAVPAMKAFATVLDMLVAVEEAAKVLADVLAFDLLTGKIDPKDKLAKGLREGIVEAKKLRKGLDASAADLDAYGAKLSTLQIGTAAKPVLEFFDRVEARTRDASDTVGVFADKFKGDIRDSAFSANFMTDRIKAVTTATINSVTAMTAFRKKLEQVGQLAGNLNDIRPVDIAAISAQLFTPERFKQMQGLGGLLPARDPMLENLSKNAGKGFNDFRDKFNALRDAMAGQPLPAGKLFSQVFEEAKVQTKALEGALKGLDTKKFDDLAEGLKKIREASIAADEAFGLNLVDGARAILQEAQKRIKSVAKFHVDQKPLDGLDTSKLDDLLTGFARLRDLQVQVARQRNLKLLPDGTDLGALRDAQRKMMDLNNAAQAAAETRFQEDTAGLAKIRQQLDGLNAQALLIANADFASDSAALTQLRKQAEAYQELSRSVGKFTDELTKSAKAKAGEVFESTRQPLEKFQAELLDLAYAVQLGGLGLDDYSLAVLEAVQGVEKLAGVGEVKLPQAIEAGSAEAVSAQNRFLAGQTSSDRETRIVDAINRLKEVQEQQLKEARETAKAIQKLSPVKVPGI